MGTAISSLVSQTPSQDWTEDHSQTLPEAEAEISRHGAPLISHEGLEDEDDQYGQPTHSCEYCNRIFSAMNVPHSTMLIKLMSCADAKAAAQVCTFFQQILQPWTEGSVTPAHVYLYIATRSHWPGSGYYGNYREAKVLFLRDRDHTVVEKIASGIKEGIPLVAPYLDSNNDPSLPVNENTSHWVYPCAGNYPVPIRCTHVDSAAEASANSSTDDWILPPNLNPSSLKAIVNIRSWFETCTTQHNHSMSTDPPCLGPSVLPSRLLHINEELGKITLVQASLSSAHYAVLSYCWGRAGTQQVQTLKGNVIAHEGGIPITSLPKTLQDAVTVASQLQISYLWIDALCIVQDDTEDIQKEISKMPQIYQNSAITILAGDAADSTNGFLHQRKRKYHRYSITFKHKNERMEKVLLEPRIEEDWQVSDIMEGKKYTFNPDPVSKRGWILQEVLLSPRLLYYSPSQIIFHCASSLFADGGLPEYAFKHRFVFQSLYTSSGTSQDVQYTLDQWNSIVANYSNLGLSFSSDKLPAISAVAQAFNAAHSPILELKPIYLAGIWRNTLPFGLLWQPCESGRRPRRRPPYRAPSWSWASINGHVRSPPCKRLSLSVPYCRVAFVESCTIVHKAPSNPYGEVLSGELKITAPLTKVKDYYMAENGRIYLENVGDFDIDHWDGYVDALEEAIALPCSPASGHELALLCIIRLPCTEDEVAQMDKRMREQDIEIVHFAYHLLLLKRGEENVYSRLGLVETECADPLRMQEDREDIAVTTTVTLI